MVFLTDLIQRFFSEVVVGWSDQDLEWRLWKLYIHIHTFICVFLFGCLSACLPTCLSVCPSGSLSLIVCLCVQMKNIKQFFFSVVFLNKYSHKKWKDSLETRAVLLILLLELEIFRVIVQWIHQNSEKWWLLWGTA